MAQATGRCNHNGCYCNGYVVPISKWAKGKCKSCNHPEKEHGAVIVADVSFEKNAVASAPVHISFHKDVVAIDTKQQDTVFSDVKETNPKKKPIQKRNQSKKETNPKKKPIQKRNQSKKKKPQAPPVKADDICAEKEDNEEKEEKKESKETEVETFLRNTGFANYVQTFNENEFRLMEELRHLTANNLKEELGIKPFAHRMKIIALIKEYFAAKSDTISLMDYAPTKPLKYVDNPLIIFFGISKYQHHSTYPELDDIHEDEAHFRKVFEKELNYDFVSNDYSKKWNKSDAEDWIESIRNTVLFRDGVLRYNAIVFCGASHGSTYAMITSDSLRLKVKDIRSLFAWNVNKKLRFLPKIFVFNCCRTKYKKPRAAEEESAAAGYSVSITGTEGDPVFGCKLSRCVASAFRQCCDSKKDIHQMLVTATKTAREECGMSLRLQEHDIAIDDVKFVKNPQSRGSRAARIGCDHRNRSILKKTEQK